MARAFEEYLREGTAPSPQLRGTFQRFKLWMTDIYRQVKALVTMTPEVRGIFDRMLATDDAIEAVNKELGTSTFYKDQAHSGMNDKEWAAYQRDIADSRNAADAKVFSQAMKAIRQQNTKTYNRERDGIRKEAAAHIDSQPAYRAANALVRGLDKDGEPLMHAPKLSRQEIEKDYGKGVSKLLRGITTTDKSAWSLNFAADQFGFRSGSDLYEAMRRENFVPRDAAPSTS